MILWVSGLIITEQEFFSCNNELEQEMIDSRMQIWQRWRQENDAKENNLNLEK